MVNIQSFSSNPYNLICFNSLGQVLFEMNNLISNQAINLPRENGIYFIKITDHQNQMSLLKCMNAFK
jgi:hypothetical protein